MEQQVIALDSQWFNGIQNCPQKLKYQLLDSLQPHVKPAPLDRGDLLHVIMDAYYKCRMETPSTKHKDNLAQALEKGRLHSVDLDLPAEEITAVMKFTAESLDFHQSDGWMPVAVEQPFSYTLYEDPSLLIISTGVIDLVVDIKGIGLTVVDHKSSSRVSSPSPLSNQFMNYCYGTRTLRAVINQIGFQKTVPAEQKYRRIVLSYQQPVLDEWKEDTIFWVKFGLNLVEQDRFPKNLTSCDKYAGCIYQSICATIPEARAWKIGVNFHAGKPWDPYTKGK
jgi:hypothetical protein